MAAHVAKKVPTAEEKARAQQEYRSLKEAVIRGTEAGRQEKVFIDFAGSTSRAKLISAGQAKLVFSARGLEVPVNWERLSPNRFYGIARKYTDNHRALSAYCQGVGLFDAANEERKLILDE